MGQWLIGTAPVGRAVLCWLSGTQVQSTEPGTAGMCCAAVLGSQTPRPSPPALQWYIGSCKPPTVDMLRANRAAQLRGQGLKCRKGTGVHPSHHCRTRQWRWRCGVWLTAGNEALLAGLACDHGGT